MPVVLSGWDWGMAHRLMPAHCEERLPQLTRPHMPGVLSGWNKGLQNRLMLPVWPLQPRMTQWRLQT